MVRTIGERLLVLKEHSGLSLAEIARRGGYQGASSIQKLFRPNYSPKKMPPAVAERLANALEGTGNPKIERIEVTALAGNVSELDEMVAELKSYTHSTRKFVALFHTRRVRSEITTEEGDEVPQFIRRDNENGLHFPTPDHLRPRSLVAFYLMVGNMWPRFEEGEILIYEHERKPRVGDDVVLTLIHEDNLDGAMVVGRLALLHDEEVQIDQLSPRGRAVIPRRDVISVYRLLTAADMLPPQIALLPDSV